MMIELNQLSRVQSTASTKADTTARESKVETSDAKKFGDHLDQQIEQSQPLKKQQNTENNEDNQPFNDGDGDGGISEQAQPEDVEGAVAPAAGLLNQLEAEVVDDGWFAAQQVDQLSSDHAEEGLQVLVADGNDLPPVAAVLLPLVTQQPVQGQIDEVVTQQVVKLAQPKISVETVESQVLVKATLNKTGDSKPLPEVESFVAPELKLSIKNSEQGFDKAMQARADTAVVSKLNMATVLQQVPVTTNVAAMQTPTSGSMIDNSLPTLPSLSASINTPLQSPAWSQNVAERVNWMVNGNFQNAQIKLNPAHLGPMEIKLSVQDDKASIVFVTSHAPVREALEAALPRLREMLEQQGLSLVDVDVSDHSADGKEQADSMSDSDSRQRSDDDNVHKATLMNQSVINVDVSDGINIYA